jgi:LuxR family maltose regulon positive regulatory protein
MRETLDRDTPAGRRHIIERPRLTRLLDETSARVIMLVAPAGYGKTTLARQWLEGRPHAWYQASAASADLAALGGELADVCGSVLDDVGVRLHEWLPTRRGADGEAGVAADLLSADLEHWPEGAWLSIDDYHYIDSADAETMIDRLVAQTDLHVLITSRRRPAWATSRRLLYGEVFELSDDVLAMNSAEAEQVMAGRSDEASRTLLRLANGWPAVIGLAASAHFTSLPSRDNLPSTLHDYLADELFSTLSESAQQALCEAALLPRLTMDILIRFLGETRAAALRSETPAGLISQGASGELLVHPLLRAFLLRKFHEFDEPYTTSAIARATHFLTIESWWEEAFALIQEFARPDLLDELITTSLYDLLHQGRLSTLKVFIEYARDERLRSLSLDLASAEYAFRQGFHERAKALAHQATDAFPRSDPLASKAFFRAGQSAYFVDEWSTAMRDLLVAKELARDPDDLRSATWAYFIVAVELGDAEARGALAEFEAVGAPSVDDLLRLQNGRLLIATRYGELDAPLAEARSKLSLVEEARDPVACASFLHIYSAALRLASRYAESLSALAAAFEGVNTFNLDFARPHLTLTKAATALGLRSYREAGTLLDEVEGFARERDDVYVLMNALAWHCRLLLLQGQARAALTVTAHSWPRLPCRGQYAEYLACRALAFARSGAVEEARDLLEEAESGSDEIEARSLCNWTRALLSLWKTPYARGALSDETIKDVHQAFDHSVESGALDAFVLAYRLDKAIVAILSQDSASCVRLADTAVRTSNDELTAMAGLSQDSYPILSPPLNRLTKRELEVFDLLAQGRSNKEIAQTLVLSEATAKVHVRHILRKLNVRTRTEAAILAARMPLPAR